MNLKFINTLEIRREYSPGDKQILPGWQRAGEELSSYLECPTHHKED